MLPSLKSFLNFFLFFRWRLAFLRIIALIGALFCYLEVHAQSPEFVNFLDSSSYYMVNKYDMPKAIGFAEKAQEVALRIYGENNLWYAASYMLLAKCYFFSKDFKKAVSLGEQSAERLKKMVEKESTDTLLYHYSSILWDLAQIYSDSKMLTRAENSCLECMRINPAPESGKTTPFTLYSYLTCQTKLADLYFVNGKKRASIPVYEANIKLLKQEYKNNPKEQQQTGEAICAALNNLGFVHNDMGNEYLAELTLREAVYFGEKALPLSMEAYNSALVNLATTLTTLSQFKEAQVYFNKAVTINSQLNQEVKLAMLKSNMAALLKNLTSTERKELRLQSLDLFRKTRSTANLRAVLEGLAEDCINLGELEDAGRYLSEADTLDYPAHSQLPDGNIVELRSMLALAQNKPLEALRLNELAIFKYPEHAKDLPKVWFHKAVILTRLKKIEEAQSAWRKIQSELTREIETTLPYLSEYQREQYTDNYDNYREQYLSFICSNKQPESENGVVYNLLLNAKGALLERERRIRREIGNTTDTTLLKKQTQYLNNRKALAKYHQSGRLISRTSMDSLETETEILEKEISRSLPASQYRVYQWPQVQAALKPGEAAIEMVRFRLWDEKQKKEKLYGEWRDSVYYGALILLPNSKAPQLVLLPNGRALEGKHLQAYRTDMERRTYETDSYQAFWGPIGKVLGNIKTIHFSPDGVYHQISLNTLRNQATGRFLSEEMNIRLVGSTRALADTAKSRVGPLTVALFGYPDYQLASNLVNTDSIANLDFLNGPALMRGDMNFTPLLGTKKEVESIHKTAVANGWTSQVFIEQEASEGRIKRIRNTTVLHIATHGYFLKDTSQTLLTKRALFNSGLVLAGALDSIRYHNLQAEDGLLTAYEAADLHLDGTQLVTLSACETGLGLIRNGNGVFGLQRAFLAAGAKSVLMSLWRVNDLVSKELMEKFYGYWLGGMSKQSALMKAQAEIRNTSETLSHPYYWGGFVLTEQ